MLVARARSSPPYQDSTALCCVGGGALPRSCSSLPSGIPHRRNPATFCPLGALQDLLSSEQVASYFVWTCSRAAVVEETGSASSCKRSSMVLSAQRVIRGVQQPHSLQVTTTPKKLSFL